MMPPTIGVNLRVTGHCNQGRRKYMEDAFAVAYQQTSDERDLEYAYFGIFDGHGGRDAALFAKENLMNSIVNQKNFWSDDDENVLKAIKEGFLATHMAMWKQVGTWPPTVSGLPSTSGTTASVVFIRKSKLYIGHVGDSAIVLGYKDPDGKHYRARQLTSDHKPESPEERKRIENVGGSVIDKCGVQRVVWNRPKIGHTGPVRRSTHIDQIPFLAVARSLGDLWSYDYFHGKFVVSPEPDVCVVPIDPRRDRCIILATDGVWNMLTSEDAVRIVEESEIDNERKFMVDEGQPNDVGEPHQRKPHWIKPYANPSRLLVDRAISLWACRRKRADNTSVVTVMIDPPGPSRSEVLSRKRMLQRLRPRDEAEAGPSASQKELVSLHHAPPSAGPVPYAGDSTCERDCRSHYHNPHYPPPPPLERMQYFSPAPQHYPVPPPRPHYPAPSPPMSQYPPPHEYLPHYPPQMHRHHEPEHAAPQHPDDFAPPLYHGASDYPGTPPFETMDASRRALMTAPTPPPPGAEEAPPTHYLKPVPLQRISRHQDSFSQAETPERRHNRHHPRRSAPKQDEVPDAGGPIFEGKSGLGTGEIPDPKVGVAVDGTPDLKRKQAPGRRELFALVSKHPRLNPDPLQRMSRHLGSLAAEKRSHHRRSVPLDKPGEGATLRVTVYEGRRNFAGADGAVPGPKVTALPILRLGKEPALKRKLPPGGRELFALVAKHSRLPPGRREPAPWLTCRTSSVSQHITRSHERLRKVQV